MADFLQLKPELYTLGAALLVILLDLAWPRGDRRWLGWLSGALAALGLVLIAAEWRTFGGAATPLWGGVLVIDDFGLMFKLIFLLGVAVAAIGSAEFAAERFRHVG